MSTHQTQPPAITTEAKPPKGVFVCAIEGCDTRLEITEPVSAQLQYVCSHHSRKEQLATVGRVFDPDKDEQDKEAKLQKHQFEKYLRKPKRPFGTMHVHRQGNPTTLGDESTEALFNNIAQSMPKGFSIETTVNYQTARPTSPDWVKTRDLISFIINRLKTKERVDLLQRKVPLWAALDHTILVEYYLLHTPDEDIFDKYKSCLQSESSGKKRWTSSVNALKNRRLRLVKEGNSMFGENETADQADGAKETRNDDAAHICDF